MGQGLRPGVGDAGGIEQNLGVHDIGPVSFDPNREGCASGQHLVDDIQDHLRTTRFMNVDDEGLDFVVHRRKLTGRSRRVR